MAIEFHRFSSEDFDEEIEIEKKSRGVLNLLDIFLNRSKETRERSKRTLWRRGKTVTWKKGREAVIPMKMMREGPSSERRGGEGGM